MNYQKYRPYPDMDFKNRTWPEKKLTLAPIWCSVDLRDGNQALEIPMSLEEKLDFYNFLLKTGFKEIEIGFPASSDTEFAFTRYLIENDLIPDDVTVQVLTQSRPHIIKRTFESLKGAKRAIVHLYNSTSTLQREVVFGNTKEETIDLAVSGAKLFLEYEAGQPETDFFFEYSPESFTGTEMPFAVEICNAVLDVWKPDANKKVIINLPSTVEMTTPNIYADQIEYCSNNLKYRENVILSVHAHNDQGCAVAATELALMAGAQRAEGTIFGNGERTGNTDLVCVALNLFTQGIDPKLDFSHIDDAVKMFEKSTRMELSPRHPYAGNLVYTAFSGSHQDAIRKGMNAMRKHPDRWEVPYLLIDPKDVGRSYDPIVRINSQSGKGGVAFVLQQNYGIMLPKAMQQDLSYVITNVSDKKHSDLTPNDVKDIFEEQYVDISSPLELKFYRQSIVDNVVHNSTDMTVDKKEVTIEGEGNGVIEAFCHALESNLGLTLEVINYSEHSMEYGTKARAISYMQILINDEEYFGAGTSSDITKSSYRAIISALNNYYHDHRDKIPDPQDMQLS